MTDRKTSTSSHDAPSSESLSDHRRQSVSDSEFLAELDMVLEADSQGNRAPFEPATVVSAAASGEAPADLSSEQMVDADRLERRDEAKLELISDTINAYQYEAETPYSAPESAKAPLKAPTHAHEDLVADAIEHAWYDGSARWLGVLVLLGILAVGMGGVSLWQVGNIEDRLNRVEPVFSVNAAPVLDIPSAENAQRIGDLEQRLGRSVERMQADAEALGASLTKELDRRNERLDGDLAALNTTLSVLQEQLRAAQVLMAEADKMGDWPANSPIATDAASAQFVPAPGPPIEEGAVESAPSVSTASEKTSGWSVNLFAADRQDKSEKELARIRALGVPAGVFSVINNGKVWHRIAVRGFDSFEKASAYAETLRSKPGMSNAWVGRN